jgi:hypothetical protein
MTTVTTQSPTFTLTLSEEERTQLLNFLEQADRRLLVEVHRTEAPDFRESVERKESALRSVIDKLRRA